jgi:hypothetical protein
MRNPSFESDSDWAVTVNDSDGKYSASYTTAWASDHSRSFLFQRGTGAVTAGYYAQISQENVNLTGVTKLLFDCQDTGIDTVPLRFIVDDSQVVGVWQNNGWPGGAGSGWGHTAETFNIEIPLATAFSGLHKLTIQMINPISHYPADPKVYRIDNLRTTPEPAVLPMLALLAAAGFLLLRARKTAHRAV